MSADPSYSQDRARQAYDAAVAQLMGCRGLFAAPRTEAKLGLLRERLLQAGEHIADAYLVIANAAPEAPFTEPPADPVPPHPAPRVVWSDARTQAGSSVLPFRRGGAR